MIDVVILVGAWLAYSVPVAFLLARAFFNDGPVATASDVPQDLPEMES